MTCTRTKHEQAYTYGYTYTQLALTLEGSALMPLAPKNRRQLWQAAKASSEENNFQLTVEVLPSGKTDLLPGSQGTASGVCNLVVSMLIAISMFV